MDKRILAFALIYTSISIYFVHDIKQDESASMGYVFVFPIFWILSGLILYLIIKIGKINWRENIWNKIGVLFSTPIPIYTFSLIWLNLPNNEVPISTYEFNESGLRYREVKYQDRKEYFHSKDTIEANEFFPNSDDYLLDSVVYFEDK